MRKRFLIPLLAAFALPTAVNAESYWLVLSIASLSGKTGIAAMEKIEVDSPVACDRQGKQFSSLWKYNNYMCFVGK